MGNSQPCTQCNELLASNLAYGEYELQVTSAGTFVVIRKTIATESQLESKVHQELQKRKQLNCQVVKLYKYAISTELQQLHITLYYEYFPKTLQQKVQNKLFLNEPFTEIQLIQLTKAIENALISLYSNNIEHGCINLETILCDGADYKITDVSSTTYITSYDLALKGQRDQFLSEKLINNLAFRALVSNCELSDDLYSLGLIILLIVSRSEVSNFYIWNNKNAHQAKMNEKHIRSCLRILERNYSRHLCCVVKGYLLGPAKEKEEEEESTALSDSLHSLEEKMSRVFQKIKKLSSPNEESKGFEKWKKIE